MFDICKYILIIVFMLVDTVIFDVIELHLWLFHLQHHPTPTNTKLTTNTQTTHVLIGCYGLTIQIIILVKIFAMDARPLTTIAIFDEEFKTKNVNLEIIVPLLLDLVIEHQNHLKYIHLFLTNNKILYTITNNRNITFIHSVQLKSCDIFLFYPQFHSSNNN